MKRDSHPRVCSRQVCLKVTKWCPIVYQNLAVSPFCNLRCTPPV
ncbi:unnamed protein product [Brassica oleracea]